MQTMKINKDDKWFKFWMEAFAVWKLVPESDDDWSELIARAGETASAVGSSKMANAIMTAIVSDIDRRAKNG